MDIKMCLNCVQNLQTDDHSQKLKVLVWYWQHWRCIYLVSGQYQNATALVEDAFLKAFIICWA